jgi:hypothetical protein
MVSALAVPDPELGVMVELDGGDAGGTTDLAGVDESLAILGLTAEKPSPRLLGIEPSGADRDKDLADARVSRQPSGDGRSLVAGQVVGHQVKIVS